MVVDTELTVIAGGTDDVTTVVGAVTELHERVVEPTAIEEPLPFTPVTLRCGGRMVVVRVSGFVKSGIIPVVRLSAG